MKKPPKASKAIATYFTAKRMEDAGLLRPGTALLLASSPTKTVKRFPERMVNRMKTSRGGGQSGGPALQSGGGGGGGEPDTLASSNFLTGIHTLGGSPSDLTTLWKEKYDNGPLSDAISLNGIRSGDLIPSANTALLDIFNRTDGFVIRVGVVAEDGANGHYFWAQDVTGNDTCNAFVVFGTPTHIGGKQYRFNGGDEINSDTDFNVNNMPLSHKMIEKLAPAMLAQTVNGIAMVNSGGDIYTDATVQPHTTLDYLDLGSNDGSSVLEAWIVTVDVWAAEDLDAVTMASLTEFPITSSDSVSVDENATLSHSLTADRSGTFALAGGIDRDQFEVSGATLRWAGNGVADYELPVDSDTDNIYQAIVSFTEGSDAVSYQRILVTVNDVFEEDATPDAFGFTDVTNADLSTQYESDYSGTSGINVPVALSITGGEYELNSGLWSSDPTTTVNGDYFRVRTTSSGTPNTAVTVTLTIGGVAGTFTVTTAP
jgi:hypothetical protein